VFDQVMKRSNWVWIYKMGRFAEERRAFRFERWKACSGLLSRVARDAHQVGSPIRHSPSECSRLMILVLKPLVMSAKSLVPYRQCSACRNSRLPMLLVRSIVDTAICAKPLARWTYGDWMPPAGSRGGQPGTG
jgi:hypothetical protein